MWSDILWHELNAADAPACLMAILGLLALVLIGQVTYEYLGVSPDTSRAIVHCGVGIFVANLPSLFASTKGVYLVAIIFVVTNYLAWKNGMWSGIHQAQGHSLGTVTFPLALIPAVYLCWTLNPNRLYAYKASFLVLAIADPLAAYVGRTMSRPGNFYVNGGYKSVAGCFAFFLSAVVINSWVINDLRMGSMQSLLCIILVSLMMSIAEAVGSNGWDNLYIVMSGISTWIFLEQYPQDISYLLIAISVGMISAALVFRRGM